MLTISYAVYVQIIVRYSLYVLYAHTGHVKSAVIHILNNITKKIVLMVDNHNTFMGIPETRNKMSKFLIKHKKLCVLYCILQINVPCYYLDYSTGVCTTKDIFSSYLISVWLGYR